MLREAAIEGQKVERAANRTLNEKSLASLKTKGMQVNEVSAAEQSRIRAKVAAVSAPQKVQAQGQPREVMTMWVSKQACGVARVSRSSMAAREGPVTMRSPSR